MVRKLRPSPALVVAALALFFAIGGSAFAVVGRTEAAQPRCALGAVRGIAEVTGDPKKGMPNMPDSFSTSSVLFAYRWNCSGGEVAVRRSGNGFDVKFGGNAATIGLGTAVVSDGGAVAVTRNPDGSFHVAPAGDVPNANFRYRNDMPFVIAVI
jgi:hypothetical protein